MEAKLLRPESIRTTAFFTGHRLLPHENRELAEAVFNSIAEAYENGYRRFISGCALGFDTIAAIQTIRLRDRFPDVRLSLAVPCPTQADRWNDAQRRQYADLLEQADEKTVISPFYYQGVMLTRNRFMADQSSLCICYLNRYRGGTAFTVRYALHQGNIRIINLAVRETGNGRQLKEEKWNYTFISPSVHENADIARLRLMSEKKLILKHTSDCC